MTDYLGLITLLGGFTVVASGQVWLLARAFAVNQTWATIVFFFPVLTPVYILVTLKRSWAPGLVLVLGALTVAAPIIWKSEVPLELGERLREVDGEQHLTLSGWDRKDYALLERLPNLVVLQMANPEVTDETLKYLVKMPRLRELDLNDSQVTDAGLKLLRGLPKLQVLRLRKTKITDAGFREQLLPMEVLRNVEVTGTDVKGATLREWKKAKPGRDYIN